MEKYIELLNNVAEQLAQKTAPGAAIVVDLERIERILSAAERKIETAHKAS